MDHAALTHRATAPTLEVCRAVVQVGEVETEYARAGCGPVVVLLCGADGVAATRDPAGDAVFAALASRFRVIAPVSAPGIGRGVDGGQETAGFDEWLEGMLEGLGIGRASVVVDERLAGDVVRFCIRRPGRIGRLVVIDGRAPADAPALHASVSEPGGDPRGVIADALSFLSGETGELGAV